MSAGKTFVFEFKRTEDGGYDGELIEKPEDMPEMRAAEAAQYFANLSRDAGDAVVEFIGRTMQI
ncbi:MAG: hypothetical protein NC324_03190 [Bacteroides sp.]|nr:hypothetical protein [Bacteroides sp.]